MIIITNLRAWQWTSVTVVVAWPAARGLVRFAVSVVLSSVVVLSRICIKRGVSGCRSSNMSALVPENTACSSPRALGWCWRGRW